MVMYRYMGAGSPPAVQIFGLLVRGPPWVVDSLGAADPALLPASLALPLPISLSHSTRVYACFFGVALVVRSVQICVSTGACPRPPRGNCRPPWPVRFEEGIAIPSAAAIASVRFA